MANDYTILPNFASTEGANTAILQDGSVLDNYWKAAENQYRNKVFDYKKKKDEADQILKMIDFDKTGIRPQDLEPITNYAHEGMYKFAYDYPKSLHPLWDDKESMRQATQLKENEDEAHYRVGRSKLIRGQYDIYKKSFIEKKDADGLQALEEWYKQPLETIGEFDYVPKPDYNTLDIQQKILKDVPSYEEAVGGGKYVGGGQYSIPTVTKIDVEQAEKNFNSAWEDDLNNTQQHFKSIWSENAQDQAFATKFPTPKEYARSILLPPEIQAKGFELREPNTGGSGGTKNIEDQVRFIAVNAKDLSDPNSEIYIKTTSYQGKEAHLTNAFNGVTLPTTNAKGEKVDSQITGIFNIDGKIYARTSARSVGQKGAISVRDLIPITDVKNQLIVPYVNKEYGSSPNTAELAQATLNVYDGLGGKSNNAASKPNSYSYKGKTYTQSQVEAAAKQWGLTVDEYVKKYLK